MATIKISSVTGRSPNGIVPGFLGFVTTLIRSNFRMKSRGAHFDDYSVYMWISGVVVAGKVKSHSVHGNLEIRSFFRQ